MSSFYRWRQGDSERLNDCPSVHSRREWSLDLSQGFSDLIPLDGKGCKDIKMWKSLGTLPTHLGSTWPGRTPQESHSLWGCGIGDGNREWAGKKAHMSEWGGTWIGAKAVIGVGENWGSLVSPYVKVWVGSCFYKDVTFRVWGSQGPYFEPQVCQPLSGQFRQVTQPLETPAPPAVRFGWSWYLTQMTVDKENKTMCINCLVMCLISTNCSIHGIVIIAIVHLLRSI